MVSQKYHSYRSLITFTSSKEDFLMIALLQSVNSEVKNSKQRNLAPFSQYLVNNTALKHGVHWGITPPQKHHSLFLAKPPPPFLLNLQTIQVRLFWQPPYILVFHNPTPHPKNWIFQ